MSPYPAAPVLDAAELLVFVGVTTASAADSSWADRVADAVDVAVRSFLDWRELADTDPPPEAWSAEITGDALLAGQELWARRGAPFGSTGFLDQSGSLVRFAKDYLEAIKPALWRHRNHAGLMA